MRLRAADASDAPAIASLVDAAYRHYVERIGTLPGPMRDDYAEVAARKDTTLAVEDGELVGVLVLAVDDEGFVVENVAVAPSRQGRGLGRTLLALAERRAAAAGHDAIHLYTHELMTENRALYARLGWAEYDRRTEHGLTRVFLRKAVPPAPRLEVSTVSVSAPDVASLVAFYTRLLGLAVVAEEPEWVLLRHPSGRTPSIAVQFEENYARPVWPSRPGEPDMKLHLEIEVDDLDAAVAHALDCGAELAGHQPQDDVRVCLDPAGHPFCLWVPT